MVNGDHMKFKGVFALLALIVGLFASVTPAQATTNHPTISGNFSVGQTLHLEIGDWDFGTTPVIQWTRDFEPISGATSGSYELVNDDYLKLIGARLIGTIDGFPAVRLVNGFSRVDSGTLNANFGASTVAQFVASSNANCAVELDKSVLCNGSNGLGQLGRVLPYQSEIPLPVPGVGNALQISMFGGTVCTLLDDGSVKCWGDNRQGQAGSFLGQQNYPLPTTVPGVSNAVGVFLSNGFGCALIHDGQIKCWGTANDSVFASPIAVSGISNAISISMESLGCALLADSTARCFGGSGFSGVMGNITREFSSGFNSVAVSNLSDAKSISTGSMFSCAILNDETVKCWGSQTSAPSYLGGSSLNLSQGAVTVPILSGAVKLSTRLGFCAQFQAGTTKCAGSAWFPGGTYRSIQALTEFPEFEDAELVTGALDHGCSVFSNGSVKCWGNNDWGQIGLGNPYSTSPLDLPGYGIQYIGDIASPTISGETLVGNTLSLNAGDWGSDATYKYSYNGAAFTSSNSVELTSDMAGDSLDFEVLILKPQYAFIKTTISSDMVTGGVIEQFGTPVIIGQTWPGQTLSVTNEGNSWDEYTTLTYRWLRGATPIAGATGVTYQIQNADLSQTVKVEVTGSRAGFEDRVVLSAPTAEIGRTNLAVPRPYISGKTTVGTTLAIKYSKATSYTYRVQWYSGTSPISGATGSTYKLPNSLAGSTVKAILTVSRPEYKTLIVATQDLNVTGGTIPLSSVPIISGDLLLGSTLTVSTPNWDGRVSFSNYKWVRDGSTKVIGSGTTYVLTTADVGHKIRVTVTGSAPGFNALAKTSSYTVKTLPGTLSLSPEPTISGSGVVGSTLTALPGAWQTGVKFSYQWFQDGKAIKKATSSKYKIPSAARNHLITVRVTGSATGYLPKSVISLPFPVN